MEKQIRRAGYLDESYHYFHLRDTAGQELDFHYHDFDKLVILLSGRVRYLVENEEYDLLPREILLVRHHCIHKAVIDRTEPYERIIVYLHRGFAERMMPEARLMNCFDRSDESGKHLLQPDEGQWQELSDLFRRLESVPVSADDPWSQPMRDTMILQLLILLERLAPGSAPGASAAPNPKIRETLAYIDGHLGEDLSVDSLAGRVWLSRYHFMRLFRQQTGQSVHAYVRQRRLLYAARLIREGMPAGQAAEACGYQDYSAFHRAFLSSFGCTPGRLNAAGHE